MKLSEIKVLETPKMSNQDWAKDMIKIIKSVDSKIDTGVGGMGSSDMEWVDKNTANMLSKKFKEAGYSIKQTADMATIFKNDNPSVGISIHRPDPEDKDLPEFKEKRGLMFYDESLSEALKIHALNSGAMHSKSAKDAVRAVMSKRENVIAGDKEYKAFSLKLDHDDLEKGQIVLASYSSTNQGAQVYEILGFTDDDKKYGDGGVKFDSVKDLLKAKGVATLKELEALQNKNEYGLRSYIVVRDLDDKEEGPWFYLYKGSWSRGSGAEKLSFVLLKEV